MITVAAALHNPAELHVSGNCCLPKQIHCHMSRHDLMLTSCIDYNCYMLSGRTWLQNLGACCMHPARMCWSVGLDFVRATHQHHYLPTL